MTTPATFAADLAALQGGGTLELEDGNYADGLNLTGKVYPTPITIISVNPYGAKFNRIKLTDCEGFTLDALSFKSASKYVIETQRGAHIRFNDCKIDTDFVGAKTIYANFTKDIRWTDCYLAKMGDDGFHLSGVDGFTIKGTRTSGIFQPAPSAHIDFLQMRLGTSNGVIEDNVFIAVNISNVQGVFWDDVSDPSQVFKNIEVRNNVVVGMSNCIRGGGSTGPSSGCSAINNTCVSVHPTHALGMVSIGNGVDEDNFELGVSNFADYYEGTCKLGMTIEDFRPKPGTAAETSGAFELIDQILSGETDPGPEPEPDVDSITLVEVTIDDPEMGEVEMVGGKVQFTPNPGYSGPVSGTYTIRDEAGGESMANWSGDIEPTAGPTNPPPQAVADHDAFTVPQGTAVVTIDVMANDFADEPAF